VIPVFIVLSSSRVRRGYYWLFYGAHIIGAFVTVTLVVWHASSAWYYVIPPVILYVVDQLLLMVKSTRIAHVTKVCRLPDPRYVKLTVRMDEVFKSEHYEASMDVYNKSLNGRRKKLFAFGQFFWMCVPSISPFQWHPLCVVDSSLSKRECTFVVQAPKAGDGSSWSERVCALSEKEKKGVVCDKMMELKLDGPYGEPIVIDAYRKILMVVGGAGFVSYISFFSYMLRRAIKEETQISVDLVWLCKDPKIYMAFQAILREYSARFDNDPERLFDIRLFYTQRVAPAEVSEIESSIKLSLEFGRPNLVKELSYIEGLGTFTLVMASGPPALLESTQKVAVRFGAHYREESFVL